jgi:integrase
LLDPAASRRSISVAEGKPAVNTYRRMLLPPMRIHDLRHSCATLLLPPGVDARTIMETVGQSQVSLTLNTYSHVVPTLQPDAAAKMSFVLGG